MKATLKTVTITIPIAYQPCADTSALPETVTGQLYGPFVLHPDARMWARGTKVTHWLTGALCGTARSRLSAKAYADDLMHADPTYWRTVRTAGGRCPESLATVRRAWLKAGAIV